MQNFQFTEDIINEMILKYAEESFTIRDAVKFELLLKDHPEYYRTAKINRKVRQMIRELPRIKASPGFEGRLARRLESAGPD